MDDRYSLARATEQNRRAPTNRARRRLLAGAGALSLGALLAPTARPPRASLAAQPGDEPAGWAAGAFAGELVVSAAQAWREPRARPGAAAGVAGGQTALVDELVDVSRVLHLSGRVTLTVSEGGTAPVLGGTAEATWSLLTLTALADGNRREEVRRGRLDGGELTLDAGAPDGDRRLLWQGATWRPGGFPSLTVMTYGPDGRPIGPIGDGMVAMRSADPLVLAIIWRSRDLIVADLDALSLRPPGAQFGGLDAGPGAQAGDLRQTAVGRVALLRVRRSTPPAPGPAAPSMP